ncbi:efflux RND transporter periplasmic adaptor subunit [Selenomonas sp. TAMA-11512]|uniref:efflux RND transporter periplasmic adaptor subunit n=1 Tax=Selenomonas sp. TAMA-11512 TaxID=3095337 RepID=UPI003084CB4D|nr:efflux RND transporter periplasmic adaptor subunit [Selenomonas sp. TAMA-11512]
MDRVRRILIILLALLSLVLVGCGNEQEGTRLPPKVRTMTVGQGAGAAELTYTGTVRARFEQPLAFQVSGQVLERLVNVGDRVSQGQVLARIDPRDVREQANMGDAQVAAAKAQLDLAAVNLERYRQLYAADAVAKAVLDQYQTSYDSARAAYNSALAQAATGHHALGYTALVAPSDGVISAISVEAGQIAAAGRTAMTIVQEGELEAEVSVPENQLREVAVGQEVTLSFWALDREVRGIVREIAPMADDASRTYRVRISIPGAPEGLALGMTVSARRAAASEDAEVFVLPLAAVYQPLDQPLVWLCQPDDTVRTVPVTIEGYEGKNAVRIRGLQRGDEVVTAGVHNLTEGQAVRPDGNAS